MTTRRRPWPLLPCLAALTLVGCPSQPSREEPAPAASRAMSPVVLLTDFDLQDDAVGLMRGVILSIAPGVTIADLTHRVPRFDIRAGDRLLTDGPGFYPPGSVFVIVVDPGVGTKRRAIVARLNSGTLLVAPDNGVITSAAREHGVVEVREVTNQALLLAEVSTTFHGRDVFAPVGAHLAAGVPFQQVGPVVTDWIRIEPRAAGRTADALTGEVVAIDEPFGNVLTNIPAAWLDDLQLNKGDTAEVDIGAGGEAKHFALPRADTFGDVPEGKPLLYPNSRGMASLALNMGDFARTHDIRPGAPVRVSKGAR